ncbi:MULTISPECIES: hypothetical protein [Bacteria]|uniref:hypothetical protein n=1 Tax=Bacteria TaxID=2 RepID=UPI003C7A6792
MKWTLQAVGTGVGIGGRFIPEPLISKIVAAFGFAYAGLTPGGIFFNWSPIFTPMAPFGTFWGRSGSNPFGARVMSVSHRIFLALFGLAVSVTSMALGNEYTWLKIVLVVLFVAAVFIPSQPKEPPRE